MITIYTPNLHQRTSRLSRRDLLCMVHIYTYVRSYRQTRKTCVSPRCLSKTITVLECNYAWHSKQRWFNQATLRKRHSAVLRLRAAVLNDRIVSCRLTRLVRPISAFAFKRRIASTRDYTRGESGVGSVTARTQSWSFSLSLAYILAPFLFARHSVF